MAATEKEQQELEQIERQVAEMESNGPDEATRRQIAKLQDRIDQLRREMNAPPTAWQKTELARHPQRPQTLDYIERIFTDFSEIHGDRGFGDDAAIVCGMGVFEGRPVMIVGEQKGRDYAQIVHNGCPRLGDLAPPGVGMEAVGLDLAIARPDGTHQGHDRGVGVIEGQRVIDALLPRPEGCPPAERRVRDFPVSPPAG